MSHLADIPCTAAEALDRLRSAEGLVSGLEARMKPQTEREPSGKYGREEAAGVGQLVAGIAPAHPGDEERLARGEALFADLHANYRGATP